MTSPSPHSTDPKARHADAFDDLDDQIFEETYLSTSNAGEYFQATSGGPQPDAAPSTSSFLRAFDSGGQYLGTFDNNNSHLGLNSSTRLRAGPTSNPDFSQLEPNPQTLSPSAYTHQDFLSPEYSSENVYSDLSVHTTPSIDDNFWLEANYGTIANTDNIDPQGLSNGYRGSLDDSSSGQQPAHSVAPQPTKRTSNGTVATSQLLSPVLTNTPSHTPSPASEYRNLQLGAAPLGTTQVSQNSLNVQNMFNRPARPHLVSVDVQRTPGLSGSSSNESLQVGPTKAIARTVSPIVKVSSYSRGDSPRRERGAFTRSPSKRSRSSNTSSHLAPNQTTDSSDDEVEQDGSLHQTRSALLHLEASRADDGSWIRSHTSGQAGIAPTSRGDEYVPSLKEQEQQRELNERNAEVEDWLGKSENGSEAGDGETPRAARERDSTSRLHRRAKSTGHPSFITSDPFGLGIIDDSNVPGPGILLEEESGEEESEGETNGSESGTPSPPVNPDIINANESYFPTVEEDVAPEDSEPLPRQFYRAKPWHDVLRDGTNKDTKDQPATANAAIMKFKQRADNIETASRAATFGSRRLSEADVASVVGNDSILKSLSLSGQKARERKGSFLNQASRFIPRRSSSNVKRKQAEEALQQQQPSSDNGDNNKKRDSVGSVKPVQRISSFGKSAKAGLTVGREGSQSGPWNKIRRSRSKSEIPKSPSKQAGTLGLAELMTNHGGPPMPTLASPLREKPSTTNLAQAPPLADDDDEEDEDEVMEEKGVTMDLKVRSDNIVATFDGFKIHVRQLNPRLQPFLVVRIGQEQVRRYKKLLENKVKHVAAVKTGICGAGKHCFDLDGEATFLPPRQSAKDPETTHAQFQVSGTGASDDENVFGEGAVTAALFPPGVPLPPVKRLPAEFECSLCFKVKKFQKPSDWTKHVHEDVQPFTCTFPHCTEPKSFKRKADWVRHENERHRRLEGWTCNMPDCNHTCYRKDNFVQHLIREHKKPEPKVKSTKTPKGSVSSKMQAKAQNQDGEDWPAHGYEENDDVDEVWRLVKECRHDMKKQPRDEPCKFCGNICNSWKKLTVHLAKHMEQISMPVLELVRQRDVSPDTIISPVERINQAQHATSPMSPLTQLKTEPTSASPFSMPSVPVYQSSQANGKIVQPSYYEPAFQQRQGYTNVATSNFGPHGQVQHQAGMARLVQGPATGYDVISYPAYQGQQPHQFMPINNPAASTYPPPYNAGNRLPQQELQRIRAHASPYGSRVTPVPTPMYNAHPRQHQQQQQDMYSSPVEGMAFVSQFDQGVNQAQTLPEHMPMSMQYHERGMGTGVGVPYQQSPDQQPSGYMSGPGAPGYPFQH